MKIQLALAGAALSCLAASPAFAYNVGSCLGLPVKWGTDNPTLNASPISFPTGYWRDGLQRTVDLINQNPTPFFFSLATDPDGLGLGNGQSEVWGSTDPAVLQGAPAIAYWYDTCYWLFGPISYRTESDVIFDYNSPFQWTADELKSSLIMYTGSLRQLQGTGVHEFGHAMGLLHVNTEYNVMGADFQHIWANGSSAHGYLGEDAADGATYLYGPWSFAWQDLGVAHWKYSFASGEYSMHAKTGIYNAAGVLLPAATVKGEAGYQVKRGQSVQVEFTYENNGRDSQTVNTGWYLSTNDIISVNDRLLATNTGMTLSRGDVLTYRRALSIPSDLTVGKVYWIGTVVDKDNVVADSVPSNNATYIPIRVKK
ncbi:MAG TPA: matrixin family metalloprotease [Ideonella sp.]|nr:matrixin family metalloprotease [Ideonella sp.]